MSITTIAKRENIKKPNCNRIHNDSALEKIEHFSSMNLTCFSLNSIKEERFEYNHHATIHIDKQQQRGYNLESSSSTLSPVSSTSSVSDHNLMLLPESNYYGSSTNEHLKPTTRVNTITTTATSTSLKEAPLDYTPSDSLADQPMSHTRPIHLNETSSLLTFQQQFPSAADNAQMSSYYDYVHQQQHHHLSSTATSTSGKLNKNDMTEVDSSPPDSADNSNYEEAARRSNLLAEQDASELLTKPTSIDDEIKTLHEVDEEEACAGAGDASDCSNHSFSNQLHSSLMPLNESYFRATGGHAGAQYQNGHFNSVENFHHHQHHHQQQQHLQLQQHQLNYVSSGEQRNENLILFRDLLLD